MAARRSCERETSAVVGLREYFSVLPSGRTLRLKTMAICLVSTAEGPNWRAASAQCDSGTKSFVELERTSTILYCTEASAAG